VTKNQLTKIRKFVYKKMKDVPDLQHDLEHVEMVRRNALKIVEILGLENDLDLNTLQAACLLHDLTFTEHDPSFKSYLLEGMILEKQLPPILDKFEVSEKDKARILEACVYHTFAFPFKRLNKHRGLYARVLQDADLLELFNKKRIKKIEISKKKFLYYRLLSFVSGPALAFGRRNIRMFLNFPEIASEFAI
jgi:HD superfamily phosphodiesterase